MVYKNKKSSFISLIYLMVAFAFVSSLLVLTSSKQSYVVDTWKNYAAYDFEQEVEVDENGEDALVNYISTPEQLVGAFMAINNEADEAKGEDVLDYSKLEGLGIKKELDGTKIIFKLKNSIDLAGKTWESFSINKTTTVFDGMNFTIKNVKVESDLTNVGFISVNKGTIKNLFLDSVTIRNTGMAGKVTNTGAVCGTNEGSIINVGVVNGTVKGNAYTASKDDPRCVGGVCGYNQGTISQCTNSANVRIGKYLGGIVGKSDYGSISNCFNYGKVCEPGYNKYIYMGGIAGESLSEIYACANHGEITDYAEYSWNDVPTVDISSVGGIVGSAGADVRSCGNYGRVSGGGAYSSKTVTSGGETNLDVIKAYADVDHDMQWKGLPIGKGSSTMALGSVIKNLNGKITTRDYTSGGVTIRNSAIDTQGVVIENVANRVTVRVIEPYIHLDITKVTHAGYIVNYYQPGEKTDTIYKFANSAFVGGVVGFAYENSVKIYDSFTLGVVQSSANYGYANFCDLVVPQTSSYAAIYPSYNATGESNAIVGCYELKSYPILGYGVDKTAEEIGYTYVTRDVLKNSDTLSKLGGMWDARSFTNGGDPFPLDLMW